MALVMMEEEEEEGRGCHTVAVAEAEVAAAAGDAAARVSALEAATRMLLLGSPVGLLLFPGIWATLRSVDWGQANPGFTIALAKISWLIVKVVLGAPWAGGRGAAAPARLPRAPAAEPRVRTAPGRPRPQRGRTWRPERRARGRRGARCLLGGPEPSPPPPEAARGPRRRRDSIPAGGGGATAGRRGARAAPFAKSQGGAEERPPDELPSAEPEDLAKRDPSAGRQDSPRSPWASPSRRFEPHSWPPGLTGHLLASSPPRRGSLGGRRAEL
ncbi:uncharacterized protein LOC141519076 [Macrotis lagotis]|uniref:uncharacterized protein LOC141519076 n=1 Tax=Macrotis lagotis TaxID=92651 RepID=UPI003D69666F